MKNREIKIDELLQIVNRRIGLVHGDFRQKEILGTWQNFFYRNKNAVFTVATIKVTCSSGTYVRALCNDIGKQMKVGALALDIKRTRVGKYSIKNALNLLG